MVLLDSFDFPVAYDPTSDELVAGATFTVHALDDLAFAVPLAVTDPVSGAAISPLVSSSVGVLPSFRVAGNPPQVILKSGAFTTLLSSRLGIFTQAGFDPADVALAVAAVPAAEAARDAAIAAQAAAEAVPTSLAPALRVATSLASAADGDDITAAWQAAITATPDGSTLYLPRRGTFRISSRITATGKSITVDGNGSTIVKDMDDTGFVFAGGYGTTYAVASVASTTISNDSVTQPALALTLAAGTPAWVEGDVVRVVADDIVPGGREDAGTSKPRVGQDMTVYSVVGSVVTVIGAFRDPFTTNIRVAKLTGASMAIRNMAIRTSDAGIAAGWTSGAISLVSQLGARVENVEVAYSGGAGVATLGCYGTEIHKLRVNMAKNLTGSGNFGYGVVDVSSSYTTVTESLFRRVRHAYTDGTNAVATGSGVQNYGRTFGALVANSSAHNTARTAWDTHSHSEGARFANLIAVDCGGPAVQFRGRNHTLDGLHAVACNQGVNIITETDGGSTFGMHVSNVHADRIAGQVIRVYLNDGASHPSDGVRETNPSRISNVFATQCVGPAVELRNATVELESINIVAAPTLADNSWLFTAYNCDVNGDVDFDYRKNTAGTGLEMIQSTGTGSQLNLEVRVKNLSGQSARLARIGTLGGTTAFRILALLDYALNSSALSGGLTGQQYDYRLVKSAAGSNNNSTSAPDTSSALTTLLRSGESVVTLSCVITTNKQLTPLTAPVSRTQLLTIVNASTNGSTLTIKHDSDQSIYGVVLKAGADLVLQPKQAAAFMYSVTFAAWLQI